MYWLRATYLGMVSSMKSLRVLWEKPTGRILLILLGLGVVAGVFFRVFWLSYPHVQVFDEVYFPVFANDYLHGVDVFDVHPPFGKFVITIGIWLFGNAQIGWRIMPLLFGLAGIWLLAYLWWKHTKDFVGTLFAAFCIAVDGLFIAYSRVGLMDGILFFFMIACVAAMLRAQPKKPLLLVATLIGLTASIKWVGLAVLIPVGYLAWRKGRWIELMFSLWWSAVVYLAMVGLGEYLDGVPEVLKAIVSWHIEAAQYHLHLNATHPWSSPWWSWPLLTRPVLFIYDAAQDGAVQVMTTLGNPILWWTSSLAVIGSFFHLVYLRIWKKTAVVDHPLILPLLGWAAAYLPWAFIGRVVFLYHYMPAYGFALLMVAYWLSYWWKRDMWGTIVAVAVFLLSFFYFLPLMVGWWPLSVSGLAHHIWIQSWLY